MSEPKITVLRGDCVEVMRGLPAESVDAIVTDPPYELGFMGKSWDSAGVSFDPATWAEALRVLKPGGHLLAFGGSRTYHRIAVAIEDAGLEIRDSLMWIYGSGFPKSLDVSKALDKQAGAEREAIGRNPNSRENATIANSLYEPGTVGKTAFITAPATDEAKRWEGWGTALKPSHEPIVLARKPLIGTVAENVMAHGTGALNIGASRIATTDRFGGGAKGTSGFAAGYEGDGWTPGSEAGRWPANTLWDEEAAAMLDEQSGTTQSAKTMRGERTGNVYGGGKGPSGPDTLRGYTDSGGASRFFYVAKAGKKERNAGGATNTHPTVKPIALMRYLVRLITPPGGTVLDPFLGSGSTACAAALEGFDCIGIEMSDDYADIAEARIKHWKKEAE